MAVLPNRTWAPPQNARDGLAIAAIVLGELNLRGGNVRDLLSAVTAYLKALELVDQEQRLERVEQAYRLRVASPLPPSDEEIA